MTVNGQLHARTSSGVQFTYYAPPLVAVSRVYPRGGSRDGGTQVTIWGIGFRDLGHGAHGVGGGGLHCKFGPSDLVAATLDTPGGEGPQQLRCHSPSLAPTDRCESADVRVTLNANNPARGDVALTSPSLDVGFTYYETRGAQPMMDVGQSTPQGATLVEDPAGWTGDDVVR